MEEYNNPQRKQLCKTITTNERKGKQLKSIVDNRTITQQQKRQIPFMQNTFVSQRYLTSWNDAPGVAHANIVNPIGVTDNNPDPSLYVRCHLIANRFGGPPGGNNIVYMGTEANEMMAGNETHIFNYMQNNPNCNIDYTTTSLTYDATNNTAAIGSITAVDVANPASIVPVVINGSNQ